MGQNIAFLTLNFALIRHVYKTGRARHGVLHSSKKLDRSQWKKERRGGEREKERERE